MGWCPLSYYDRPVVIVNNHFYDRYRDPYYPINSRALTMVHRDQLQSPAISRHALAASQFNALGRINLRAEQPAIRPVIGSSALRSPGSGRVPDGPGSRVIRSYGINSSLANRGALSGQSLRSPSSGISSSVSSRGRSLSSGSLHGVRPEPPVRPDHEDLSKLFLNGRIRNAKLAPRSIYGTGTSIRSGETSGPGKGYPSRILKEETRPSDGQGIFLGNRPGSPAPVFVTGQPAGLSGRGSSDPSVLFRLIATERESSSSSIRSYPSRTSGSISSPSYQRSYSTPSGPPLQVPILPPDPTPQDLRTLPGFRLDLFPVLRTLLFRALPVLFLRRLLFRPVPLLLLWQHVFRSVPVLLFRFLFFRSGPIPPLPAAPARPASRVHPACRAHPAAPAPVLPPLRRPPGRGASGKSRPGLIPFISQFSCALSGWLQFKDGGRATRDGRDGMAWGKGCSDNAAVEGHSVQAINPVHLQSERELFFFTFSGASGIKTG